MAVDGRDVELGRADGLHDARAQAGDVGRRRACGHRRVCRGGGWNFGNKNVLGEDLPPYPDTTAITLVALQDRRRQPGVVQSLLAFDRIHDGHDSGLVTSLVAICNSLFGRDGSAARAQLAEGYRSTGFLGDNKVRGLALLATGDYRRWLAL